MVSIMLEAKLSCLRRRAGCDPSPLSWCTLRHLHLVRQATPLMRVRLIAYVLAPAPSQPCHVAVWALESWRRYFLETAMGLEAIVQLRAVRPDLVLRMYRIEP